MVLGLALNFAGFNAVKMLFWPAVINGLLAPPLILLVKSRGPAGTNPLTGLVPLARTVFDSLVLVFRSLRLFYG
jgi:hypothetical protein